jgi:hypothetical protein
MNKVTGGMDSVSASIILDQVGKINAGDEADKDRKIGDIHSVVKAFKANEKSPDVIL